MGEFETLDQDEPLAKRVERHGYDRLIMLSDGVFAIALTLLALELKPNELPTGSAWEIVRHQAPKLIAYAVSFAVIGVFWAAHRRAFARFMRVDAWSTVLNLMILALIALIPAATSLLYDLREAGTVRLYLALITAIGLAQAAFWAYGAFIAKLVFPEVPLRARLYVTLANAVLPPANCALSLWSIVTGTGWGLLLMVALFVTFRIVGNWIMGRAGQVAAV